MLRITDHINNKNLLFYKTKPYNLIDIICITRDIHCVFSQRLIHRFTGSEIEIRKLGICVSLDRKVSAQNLGSDVYVFYNFVDS